jgi:hypothetical protein
VWAWSQLLLLAPVGLCSKQLQFIQAQHPQHVLFAAALRGGCVKRIAECLPAAHHHHVTN